jgi:hypothetical protein
MSDSRDRAQAAQQYLLGERAKFARWSLAFRCVDVPSTGPELDALNDMIERGREISFESWSKRVEWKELAREMGYATERGEAGLRLAKDYHVRFFASTWAGERVYYMVHSAIEFVFRRNDRIQAKPDTKRHGPWHRDLFWS